MPANTIYQILGRVERDIRQSYTGGAVDAYIPYHVENEKTDRDVLARLKGDYKPKGYTGLYYYDVNSLYPTCMAHLEMPTGKPVVFEGDILAYEPKAFGFFYCKITSPEYLEHPILQRRIKTADGVRTIAGLGSWEGWIFSEEMRNAMDYGYQFEIIRGYKFIRKNIFGEYINKLYDLRQKYSKDDPMNLIAKLLMNSLYGKFGMKSTSSKVEIYNMDKPEEQKSLSDILDDYGEFIQDTIRVGQHTIIVMHDLSNYSYSMDNDMYHGLNVNIGIASAITSYGRMFMSRFKNDPDCKLYYSDTDSIVVDRPLHSKYVGNKLGQFKLEHHIREAVFLAPKVYGFNTMDGQEVVKIKGVAKKSLENYHAKDLYKLLYKNSYVEFNQVKWFKDLFKGVIKIKDVAYRLQVTANKRDLVYQNSKFVNTRPLYYDKINENNS
jgi:hypothetical protein